MPASANEVRIIEVILLIFYQVSRLHLRKEKMGREDRKSDQSSFEVLSMLKKIVSYTMKDLMSSSLEFPSLHFLLVLSFCRNEGNTTPHFHPFQI